MTRVGGVISAKDQEPWIDVAVRSLAAEVDELVVVDDGSTDGTTEVLERLAGELGFELILHRTPAGVSVSYNEAVDALDTDLVLIQGGDDRTLPGRRALTVAAFEDPEVSLVDSLPIVIDATGLVLPPDAAGEFLSGSGAVNPLQHLFTVGNFVCAPAAGVRRGEYLAAGGFPPAIDLLQDYALWLRLLETGRFVRVPTPILEYRKHASNASREQTGVDGPRLRRAAAERDWVLNHFLDTASPMTIERLGLIPAASGGALDRDELALMYRLASADRSLTRRGLSDLFTLLSLDPDALSRLGIDRSTLADLASVADHDGAAEFGRGRAVQRAIPS